MEPKACNSGTRLRTLGITALVLGILWVLVASRMAIPSSRAQVTPGLIIFGVSMALFSAIPGFFVLHFGRMLLKRQETKYVPAVISCLFVLLIYLISVTVYALGDDTKGEMRFQFSKNVELVCFLLLTPLHIWLARRFIADVPDIPRLSRGWILLTCWTVLSVGMDYMKLPTRPTTLSDWTIGLAPFVFAWIAYKLMKRISRARVSPPALTLSP